MSGWGDFSAFNKNFRYPEALERLHVYAFSMEIIPFTCCRGAYHDVSISALFWEVRSIIPDIAVTSVIGAESLRYIVRVDGPQVNTLEGWARHHCLI